MSKSIFLFNGQSAPIPVRGLQRENEQLVDSGLSASGKVSSQRINRRRSSFSNLSFFDIDQAGLNWILKNVANFDVNLTYFDEELNRIVTRLFYFGNCTWIPTKYEDRGGSVLQPTKFRSVSVNIIDTGW